MEANKEQRIEPRRAILFDKNSNFLGVLESQAQIHGLEPTLTVLRLEKRHVFEPSKFFLERRGVRF